MKLGLLFAIVFPALAAVEGGVIDYDTVQPFPEPEPKTLSEKAAVKYKPGLYIQSGCHPYAAVNAAGDTSGGLEPNAPDSDCAGSSLGSQVYSRSGWYQDVWAIMFAWYFPKDTCSFRDINPSVRHDWINAIVWIDNPALKNPKLFGSSLSRGGDFYVTYDSFVENFMNGTHIMMEYYTGEHSGGYHTIEVSEQAGDFQDLIHWSRLTDKARNALETADFGSETPVPFNNANFEKNLGRGWEQIQFEI